MGGLIQRNKAIAKKKGTVAAAAAVGAGAVAIVVNPVLGVVALAGAAYLGWDWVSFRVRNGLRF
jgi:threonine/homoserine/homoserine lactone efflux protein